MSVPIEELSAYSLYQVQQSLDKYNKGYDAYKKSDPWNPVPNINTKGGLPWEQQAAKRAKYKSASYGIEDEYRYLMAEEGFGGTKGQGGKPPAAPAAPPAAPGNSGVSRDWTKPTGANGWNQSQDYGNGVQQQTPQPVINFETPYMPTVRNRQSAVNNQALKIDSNYTKPKNKGGTSGFKRSSSERKFNGSNASMRLNQSLSI